jgi:hypothetical protein
MDRAELSGDRPESPTMNATDRIFLPYPDFNESGWDQANDNALAAIDEILGPCAVVPAERPSTTLHYFVRGGPYVKADGTIGTLADSAVQTMPASVTRYVYLNSVGVLTVGTAWPIAGAGRFAPLAIVTAGAASIAGIVDCRMMPRMMGS